MGTPQPNQLGGLVDISQITITDLDVDLAPDLLEAALHDGKNFSGIPSLMGIIDPDKRRDVANALTRLAVNYGMSSHLINWTAERGLEECKTKETAFRENDIYSVILREYFFHTGRDLAKHLLSETVQKIALHSELFDITRTAVLDDSTQQTYQSKEEKKRVQAHARKIRKAAEEISDIVCDALPLFTNTLGPVIAVIREHVDRLHAGDKELARYSAVAIFFLRYITLAISQALEWELLPTTRKDKAAKLSKKAKIVYPPHVFRNLNLVTKLIQKIASNEKFEDYEDFHIFNEYLPGMSKRVNAFIQSMLDQKAEWPLTDEELTLRKYVESFSATAVSWKREDTADFLASPPVGWNREGMAEALIQFIRDKTGTERDIDVMPFVQRMHAQQRAKTAPDLRIVLDYIAKSHPDRQDEFNQSMVDVGKLLQARTPEGQMPYDYNTIWATFSNINTLFAHADKLREYLSGTGKSRRRLMRKITSKRRIDKGLYSFKPVLKENYKGDQYFRFDAQATYDTLVKDARFVIIVVYRGSWCTYCKDYMRAWNRQYPLIRENGGMLIGVSSQIMDFCQETAKKWKLQYPLIGDPENIITKPFGIAYSYSAMVAGSGYYPYGMAQSSVIGLDHDQQMIYSWRTDPSKQNLDGAKDRIPPENVLPHILRSLFRLERVDSELSLDTSMDSWDSVDLSTEEESQEQTCADPFQTVLEQARVDPSYAEALIRALAESKENRKLFHTVRKERRSRM